VGLRLVNDPRFLSELLLLIAIAAVGVALFERLRLPAVAGFLVMGALVGPGGLGWVDDPERVRALAELGVVFLLFEIGLELPLERVRRMWRAAALAGGLQVSISVASVTAVGWVLGFSLNTAVVFGGLVAMSSTALVMRVLSERAEIDAPQGQLAVGILLIQDLCIVPFLLLIPLLAAEESLASIRALWPLLRSVLALGVFFAVTRFVLPWILDRVVRYRSRELFTLLAILVVVGSAFVAEQIGLTLAVGAFVGGLVLSASPYAHQLFAEVVPLRGVLLGLFFTAVGMLLEPRAALSNWSGVLFFVCAVVIFKAGVVTAIVALALRQGLRLGIITGLALAQTGEFSFVLAAAASEFDLIDPGLQQAFIAGSIITLIATPFLVAAAPRVAGWLTREAESGEAGAAATREPMEDLAILLGFGLAGQTLARMFQVRGITYRAAEANAVTVQEARARGEPVVYGDVTRRVLLERLGVPRARLIVSVISDPLATRDAVAVSRSLAPAATIVVRTHFLEQVDALYAAGASAVVAEEVESTIEVLAEALRAFGAPHAAISRFTTELRGEGYETMRTPALQLDPWLGEVLEEVTSEWLVVPPEFGREASLVDLGVRARTGASVLAVERGDETIPNPAPSDLVMPGSRILAFGTPADIARLKRLLERFEKAT
jgi:CPA2 family monovalent cation:H+ antiporter-2